MKKMKSVIILLVILVILLIIALIVFLKIIPEYKENKALGAEREVYLEVLKEDEENLSKEIIPLNDTSKFYTVLGMIEKYYLYNRVGNSEAVYAMLDDEYIVENNVSKENVLDDIEKINSNNVVFAIREMYVKEDMERPIYYVYGILEDGALKREKYIMVYTDEYNIAFSLYPINKEIYNQYTTNVIGNIDTKEIEQNNFNKIQTVILSEQELVTKYFESYIKNAVHYPEEAYNSLDEEYREKKFGSYEEYIRYLTNRYDELISMDVNSIKQYEDFNNEEEYSQYVLGLVIKGLKRYIINNTDDYTEYICVDDYENYYILRATATMKYTLILDTYTVDLMGFVEKYKSANAQEKVALNIQRFVDSINDGDYKYAYSKLSDGFKNNYFPTLQSFESHINKTFYKKNNVKYGSFTEEGGLYTYAIEFTNAEDKTGQTITKTIIMQLNEGTEFSLSFNVN